MNKKKNSVPRKRNRLAMLDTDNGEEAAKRRREHDEDHPKPPKYDATERLKGLQDTQSQEQQVLEQIVAEIERLQGERVKANSNLTSRAGRISELQLMLKETANG